GWMTEVIHRSAISVFQQLFGHRQHIVHGEAELLEQLASRSRLAVSGHADDATVEADVLVPVVRMGRFDGDARTDLNRQHGLLVGSVLSVEYAGAGHGNHTHLATLCRQLV